jgi:hypothetical protein
VLASDFDWQKLKEAISYLESDCMARIRTDENALGWFQVYLNEASGQAFIRRFGSWERVEDMRGFEAFERIKPLKAKMWYHTGTAELVQ